MVWSGYLELGGNEVANNDRVVGYAKTKSDCPLTWFQCEECGTLAEALEEAEYIHANIEDAPWYDPDHPEISEKFLGSYMIEMTGVSDSTREATVVQRTADGAQVTGYRHGSREVRVRALLVGEGREALEAGMTWLRNALEPNACGVHGTDCGATDLQFFVDCPPERACWPSDFGCVPYNDEEYQSLQVDPLRRILHSVTCVSGPLVQESLVSNNGRYFGYIVEFTFVAASPFVYGVSVPLDLEPITPIVITDVPYNLAPYPSAELASGTFVGATNYSTNPSVETNATGWVATGVAVSGSAPTIVGTRSTELASVGTASFLVTATGTGAAVHEVIGYQDVTITGRPAGARVSVNIWGALQFTGTGGSMVDMEGFLEWRDASSSLGVQSIGLTTDQTGYAFQGKSLLPPVGATIARVRVQAYANFTAATVAKLFVDALAVTVP
jgi:hypothetical protein